MTPRRQQPTNGDEPNGAERDRAAVPGKPLSYLKWFVNDYRASRKVQNLHHIARGLLRELLDEIWIEGWIPDDLSLLAEICHCPLSVMTRYWPKLRLMFVPIEGTDGHRLTNRRLDAERSEQDRKRAIRAAVGKLGGIAKALKTKDVLANDSKSQTESSKSHIVKESREEESGAGTSSHEEEVPAPSRAEAEDRSSSATALGSAQPPTTDPGAAKNNRTTAVPAPCVAQAVSGRRLTFETAGVGPPNGAGSNGS